MMFPRCALSQCPQNTQHRYAPSLHHLHLPIQHTPLSWVGWKTISTTMRQQSSKQIDVHTELLHLTQAQHHSTEFAPLASPVESSEIRSAFAARLPNIFHIFSHPTPEPKTITTSSPRVDSTSGQHPQHPRTPPKLLHHPHNFLDT